MKSKAGKISAIKRGKSPLRRPRNGSAHLRSLWPGARHPHFRLRDPADRFVVCAFRHELDSLGAVCVVPARPEPACRCRETAARCVAPGGQRLDTLVRSMAAIGQHWRLFALSSRRRGSLAGRYWTCNRSGAIPFHAGSCRIMAVRSAGGSFGAGRLDAARYDTEPGSMRVVMALWRLEVSRSAQRAAARAHGLRYGALQRHQLAPCLARATVRILLWRGAGDARSAWHGGACMACAQKSAAQ